MERKIVSGIMLSLLLISTLTLAFNIQPVRASGTIYIRADGSVDPPTAPIQEDIVSVFSEPPATQWNKTYGGTKDDWGWSVIQTDDGGYVLAGSTNSYGHGNWDFWLVKTDSNGNTQWNKTYGGTDADNAWSAIKTIDGGYALVGYTRSFGSGGRDVWLVKTDMAGDVQWSKTYGGTNDEIALSIVPIDDGGYILAGFTDSFGAGSNDFWVFGTNATGDMVWNRTYGGANEDCAWSTIKTVDGGYAVIGYTYSFGSGGRDVWLVKTDAAGDVQWNKTYGGTDEDQGFCVVQTVDGGYAFVARTYSFGSGNADLWLVRTDAAGDVQWNKTYGGTDEDWSWSMIQADDGGYMVPAMTYGLSSYDLWLVRTDAAGDVQWNKTYWGTGVDRANSVVQTEDGGYALVGYTSSFGSGGLDLWLIKLAPEVHDIAITDISSSRAVVGRGHSLPINVTVENEGNFAETFNVTIYANTTQIDKQTVTSLDSGANKIVTFAWNTTDFDIGNYTISAVADTVTNETDTLDNTYTDGIVTVRLPIHDVAVVDVSPASNIVIEGFELNITVTVENPGDFTETFNVTAYANATTIEEQEVSLNSGESANLIFTWNTTGFSPSNYTISANATAIPEETNMANNNYIDGIVAVRLPIYDIAVLDVTTSKSDCLPMPTVGQGYSVNVKVTVANQGDFPEFINVTLYVNTTAVANFTSRTLLAGASVTIPFIWNTTGFAKGNYTISAYATPVPGEIDTADNTLIDGVVRVTIPGDINGDGWVDGMDLTPMGMAWGSTVGQPNYNPNADLNCDGEIDGSDLTIMGFNWGQHDP